MLHITAKSVSVSPYYITTHFWSDRCDAAHTYPHRIAKDPRFERLPCMHKGTYADDCLVQRVTQVFTHTVLIH